MTRAKGRARRAAKKATRAGKKARMLRRKHLKIAKFPGRLGF